MLAWVAELLGLPEGWHGHIEDTASTSTLAAIIAAREATGRDVIVCSEHAHSAVDKAARMLGMRLRKVPSDASVPAAGGRARRPELRAAVVVATVGTTACAAVDPVPAIADACERGRHVAARRRRLRRHGDGLPRAPLGVRGVDAPTRSSSTPTSGC